MTLPYQLERTVLIQATPETVFRFFTDTARWAKWWGAGSTIEARAGGKLYIRHPGGVEASGEVVEVSPPQRLVFTYGFNSGKPIPPGASRVTIHLAPDAAGTRLHLLHEFAEEAPRNEHIQGWRFQLSLFANIVSDEVHADASAVVDQWFATWSISDDQERIATLGRIATPQVRFRDRFSLLDGVADVAAHVGASQRFMPGLQLQRCGDVRHCQGTVLADWAAVGSDGKERMSGTNVFVLAVDGRIDSATGFMK